MARKFKRGKKWYVDYRVNGRRIWKSLGTRESLADDFLKDIEAKRVRGELMDIREMKDSNFDDFARKYLSIYGENKSERTQVWDKGTVDKHLVPFFGSRPLKHITAADIEEYKASRRATRLKDKVLPDGTVKKGKRIEKSTVNRELDLLKSLLTRGVEWGYLKESPAKGVRKFKVDVKEPVFLSPEQVETVLEESKGQMTGFLATGFNTGLRKGELFQLTWKDIDFKRLELRVRLSKSKRFRVIPMNSILVEVLRRHPRHIRSPYVFHGEAGSPWGDVRTGFNSTLARAGVPRIRIHDMRHTFISNLVAAGVDLRKVQELAGHKDIKTTMKYAHLAPDHLKDSVERLVPVKVAQETGTEG